MLQRQAWLSGKDFPSGVHGPREGTAFQPDPDSQQAFQVLVVVAALGLTEVHQVCPCLLRRNMPVGFKGADALDEASQVAPVPGLIQRPLVTGFAGITAGRDQEDQCNQPYQEFAWMCHNFFGVGMTNMKDFSADASQ